MITEFMLERAYDQSKNGLEANITHAVVFKQEYNPLTEVPWQCHGSGLGIFYAFYLLLRLDETFWSDRLVWVYEIATRMRHAVGAASVRDWRPYQNVVASLSIPLIG